MRTFIPEFCSFSHPKPCGWALVLVVGQCLSCRFLVASMHQDSLSAPCLHGLSLAAAHVLHCACSMDKLYDLMVMGLKYQLLCCCQTSELLQVGQELLRIYSPTALHTGRLSL